MFSMEENADNLCKSYLDKSLDYDSKNPESLQLLASYWLSKEDIDQAKKAILDSLETWLPKYIEADENGLDPTQVINLTYDSRINTTRILTEVNEFDKAVTVLEQLIEEVSSFEQTFELLNKNFYANVYGNKTIQQNQNKTKKA